MASDPQIALEIKEAFEEVDGVEVLSPADIAEKLGFAAQYEAAVEQIRAELVAQVNRARGQRLPQDVSTEKLGAVLDKMQEVLSGALPAFTARRAALDEAVLQLAIQLGDLSANAD